MRKIGLLIFLKLSLLAPSSLLSQVIPTEVVSVNGGFQLVRGGEPYFIKGAGGFDYPERLQAYGGNSTRTWGTDANTINLLNDAQSKGISVLMGLWVGHQAHGFNYDNAAAVQRQLDDFRVLVEMYKDHPAVLGWGIGNEVELGVSNYNLKVWNAINDIAKMIKEVDGNHITLTVTAGIDITKAREIKERAPDLDMLGVNAYGGIGGVYNTLESAGWDKPYVITEWGPNGQWEVPKTSFGSPLEQTSSEKADAYKQRYETAIMGHPGNCLGSYVFLWSNKLEQTPTWYGLFLPTGDEMETVDVMHYQWKGEWPENRAPRILSGMIEGRAANQSIRVTKEFDNVAEIQASDPDGDELTYEFFIIPEEGYIGTISSPQYTFPHLPNLITGQSGNTVTFRAPANFSNFRLYVIIRDSNGKAATMNIPFRVELAPLISNDKAILFATQDAYVRDGQFDTERFGTTDKDRLVTRTTAQENSGLNREAYIEFDLSSLDEGFDQVTLAVFGASSETTVVNARGTTEFIWNENTISWSNRFTKPTAHLTTTTVQGDAPANYQLWDVTADVLEALGRNKTKVTFILSNETITNSTISWNAREQRSDPPSLRFTFNGNELITSIGLEETTTPRTIVYPNPFAERLEIEITTPSIVTLYSIYGQIVFTGELSENTTLDTQTLTPGLYLLQINDFSGSEIKTKLVKY